VLYLKYIKMSKNEYSFHNRNRNMVNPQLTAERAVNRPTVRETTERETKAVIMQQFDIFQSLKTNNSHIKYLSETQETLSKEIVNTMGLLQKSTSKEETKQTSLKMEHINTLYNKLKTEYTEILKVELVVLYRQWPGLFDKFIEGIDRETLDHVLSVFDDYQKGKFDENEAVSHGVDYMQMKYNLPKDFFNKNAINEFTKNLHNQSAENLHNQSAENLHNQSAENSAESSK
jgi:hypothetical protein